MSTDPDFVAKLRDVVGLYVDPPKRAVVFSVDEKSQIQALNRTQPGLPLKKGRAGTMTHHYERHGTTTLFAARGVPKGLSVHEILDNYATHRTAEVEAWLEASPGALPFHAHLRLLAQSGRAVLQRTHDATTATLGAQSVGELERAIRQYITRRNANPTPFTWTASVRSMLAKVKKANATFASLH